MFNRLIHTVTFVLLAVSLTACKPSTDDIERLTRQSIGEYYSSRGQIVQIGNMTVSHIKGNEYRGVVTISQGTRSATYTVDIVSDGKTLQWRLY